MIEQELARLLSAAKQDTDLKNQLLRTRESAEPVREFCALCRSLGYDVAEGALFTVGMTASDAKLRSVNGGGVNAIEGWDDAYEQFFTELIWTS